MARFYLFPFRTLILLCVCAVSFSLAQAQIANLADDTSTPIPGAGHDYIHAFSETVNPANGSVSLRIEVPMPKGRGITLPFSFGYDSNSVHHLLPGYYPSYGTVNWVSNTGYLAQGGWSYALPGAGNFEANVTEGNYPVFFNCSVYTNYMFRDASGGLHALALSTAISNGSNPCIEEPVASGGDPQLSATLPTSPGSPPSSGGLSVFTADGTIYKFSSLGNGGPGGESFALPISVEDRNGNVINVTDNGNGNFFFTDTAGRTAISSNGFGPTGATNTLSFSGFTYQVTWKTISANFPAPPTTWVGQQGGPNEFDTCSPIPAGNDSQTVISQITLPNGKQYKFYYGADNPNGSQYQNPYGLLSEIDYPSGAWVRYKWKLSDNANELADYPGLINAGASTCSTDPTAFCPAPVPDGCLYQYQTPVVASREVGFGGSPSAALTQTFSYSTTWGSPSTSWTQKSTSVTTIDNILGKSLLTTYSYSPIPTPIEPNVHSSIPGQIPVESSVSYYDWGNTTTPLRKVNKTWYDQYRLASEQTVLTDDNNLSSQTVYSYASYAQVQEKDEYDYGQSTPSRKTLTTYQSFPGTLGVIADEPCKTVVYDGSGHPTAETDYLYDGGVNICGASGIPSVVGAGGSSLTGHDETNFSSGSQILRGNLTTKIQWAGTGVSPSTSYAYDETGQVTSMTDPNGNVTQYFYADTFLNTNTGSFTTTAGGPATGKTTNTYLTEIILPPTNGVQHIEKYSYGYNDGELTTSTDQNQQVTTYRYDDLLDRPTESDYPDGGQTEITYNDTAPSPTITTAKVLRSGTSLTSTTVMDGMGHVIQTQFTSDPLGVDLTDSTYTGQGLLNTLSNPHRSASLSTDGSTKHLYDGLGRMCLTIPPGGTSATSCPVAPLAGDLFTSYLGNCTTVTDQAGKARKSCTDALGRLTNVWEDPNGLNYETDYQYDALGNLLNVTQKGGSSQPNWRTRTFAYDSVSRLLSATNPESGTITYGYDPNGNLIGKTDARGITTTMTYDALNRMLTKRYSDGTPTATFYYDTPPAPWANIELYTNGRLVEQTTGITPESK